MNSYKRITLAEVVAMVKASLEDIILDQRPEIEFEMIGRSVYSTRELVLKKKVKDSLSINCNHPGFSANGFTTLEVLYREWGMMAERVNLLTFQYDNLKEKIAFFPNLDYPFFPDSDFESVNCNEILELMIEAVSKSTPKIPF